jgi:hypothetical protein
MSIFVKSEPLLVVLPFFNKVADGSIGDMLRQTFPVEITK